MKRRKFLILTSVGIAASTLPIISCSGTIEYDQALAQPQSLSFIWNTETIEKIGAAYLQQVPKENKEQTLAKLLFSDTPTESTAYIAAMEDKIQNDFVEGNTLTIDGWVLSRTEARQCALFSINQKQ